MPYFTRMTTDAIVVKFVGYLKVKIEIDIAPVIPMPDNIMSVKYTG